jgi:hypothetical protein
MLSSDQEEIKIFKLGPKYLQTLIYMLLSYHFCQFQMQSAKL